MTFAPNQKHNGFMRRLIYILAASALIVSGGCRHEQEGCKTPVRVRVTQISNNVTPDHDYTGIVEEEAGTELSFQVPGTIESLPVTVGQKVAAGQVIATIDLSSLQHGYDAARVALEQARDAYDRMKILHERGSISEMQWVETQSKLTQAEASERISKKNLHDSKLRAPYAGVIIAKDMEQGQSAMPGMPVVKIGRIGNVKVNISVPEAELAALEIGARADVEIPALGTEVLKGSVTEKGIAANPLTHAYDVKILVNNSMGKIMPGMVAKAQLHGCSASEAMVLPGRCVGIDERNRNFVWVVDGSRARRRFIECGRPLDGGIEILSGLSAADSVIVEGQQKVSENMSVEIID